MRSLLSGQTLCRIRNLQLTIQVVSARNLGIMASKVVRMEKRDETHGSAGAETSRKSNHQRVEELQQLVRNDSTGGWEDSWEQGVTPWDLGQPTPAILHLHQTGALPKGKALVPGCGTGYDVVAVACAERYVVGLDISDSAIKKAVKEDFFTWSPTELFDVILDYTFFCAIEPDMRLAWAHKIHDILKPGGELITLMFPMDDHVGGPPYRVSVSDYEEVLHPMGFKAVSIVDNELAIKHRKGREKLGRWNRSLGQSSL